VQQKREELWSNHTGSFIMIMHPLTRPWKQQSLWLITTWLSFSILPTCRT
jgi:hypothetical protein